MTASITFPNSSAMDATASGGGPITMLPQIVTGQPQTILSHVTDVLSKASQFMTLLQDLDKARTALGQIWSGKASDSALDKIAKSLEQFEKIIKAIQDGAKLLQEAAKLVETVQTAYKTIVSAVNPTVAALMSNPWTHAAAQALSTATSGTLRGFITSVGTLLKALGITKLGTVLTDLGTVIGAVQALFNGGTAATPTAPTTGTTAVTATPVTAPTLPAGVASTTGQAAIAGGTTGATLPTGTTLPAGTGTLTGSATLPTATTLPTAVTLPAGTVLGAGTTLPAGNEWMTNYTPTALAGQQPGATDSWIPVDHSTGTDTGAAATGGDTSSTGGDTSGGTDTSGASTGATGGHDATVTATKGDLTVTVEVPTDSGHAADFDLNVSSGSEQITEHIDVDASGKVSVS